MADVTFTSDVRFAKDNFGRFASRMDEAAMQSLLDILDVGQEAAQAAAPSGPHSGEHHDGARPRLVDNIQQAMVSATSGVVYIDAVNALSQEFGAAPHVISGNPDLVFWWKKEGKLFVGPTVNHPGNEPRPFMEEGFFAMDEAAEDIIQANYGGI